MIYIRCDECKQLFGAEKPAVSPEPGQLEDDPGHPGKTVHAVGAVADVIEPHVAYSEPVWAVKMICPPCRRSAEERGEVTP